MRNSNRHSRLGAAFRAAAVCMSLLATLASCLLAYETEHVVLVIVDGLRYSEGLGDSTHAYVPKMYEMSRQGAIVEPFLNDRHTNTPALRNRRFVAPSDGAVGQV